MTVPSGALVWCHVGLDQVRDDTPGGGVIDAQVLVEKEITQPFAAPGRIGGFDVRKARAGLVQHGALLRQR